MVLESSNIILICFLSFICSISLNNFDIFASSGAVVAVFGIYLSFGHVLVIKKSDKNKLMALKHGFMLLAPTPDTDEYNKCLASALITLKNEKTGFGLSIVGTLIWAYGGYLTY